MVSSRAASLASVSSKLLSVGASVASRATTSRIRCSLAAMLSAGGASGPSSTISGAIVGATFSCGSSSTRSATASSIMSSTEVSSSAKSSLEAISSRTGSSATGSSATGSGASSAMAAATPSSSGSTCSGVSWTTAAAAVTAATVSSTAGAGAAGCAGSVTSSWARRTIAVPSECASTRRAISRWAIRASMSASGCGGSAPKYLSSAARSRKYSAIAFIVPNESSKPSRVHEKVPYETVSTLFVWTMGCSSSYIFIKQAFNLGSASKAARICAEQRIIL